MFHWDAQNEPNLMAKTDRDGRAEKENFNK